MNTAFALLARFESPTVKLEDICDEYFGWPATRLTRRPR